VLGGIESAYAIKYNVTIDLSEEQLIDCMNTTCTGRSTKKGLEYVVENGVQSETQYPYTASKGVSGSCQENKQARHYSITGFKLLATPSPVNKTQWLATDQAIMATLVSGGPVSVSVDVSGDNFKNYKSGVFNTPAQGSISWHAMLIVGWGTDAGTDYWIIKNQWGTNWGEKGYLRFLRGGNLRHINEWPYIPQI